MRFMDGSTQINAFECQTLPYPFLNKEGSQYTMPLTHEMTVDRIVYGLIKTDFTRLYAYRQYILPILQSMIFSHF